MSKGFGDWRIKIFLSNSHPWHCHPIRYQRNHLLIPCTRELNTVGLFIARLHYAILPCLPIHITEGWIHWLPKGLADKLRKEEICKPLILCEFVFKTGIYSKLSWCLILVKQYLFLLLKKDWSFHDVKKWLGNLLDAMYTSWIILNGC